jgi:carbamoyl-phosphate synthase small subunit
VESVKPQVEGFVIRELSRLRSNFRAQDDVASYLAQAGIPGIQDVDTRALTKKLRSAGVMRGILACAETSRKLSDADLVERARGIPRMEGSNLALKVTCRKSYSWNGGFLKDFGRPGLAPYSGSAFRVTCVDFGVKHNILRCLAETGAEVTVVEFLDQILPGFDGDVRKEANKIFKKQGFEFKLSTKVTKAERKGDIVTLT